MLPPPLCGILQCSVLHTDSSFTCSKKAEGILDSVLSVVAEPEPPGAELVWPEPELEPNCWIGST